MFLIQPQLNTTSVLAAKTGSAHSSTRTMSQAVATARSLIEELVGSKISHFHFSLDGHSGADHYTYRAHGGQVYVSGNDGVMLCHGAYEYLRKNCGTLVTWEGTSTHVPAHLPDAQKFSGTYPTGHRTYFNVCTFGYSTAFWDWARWHQEIRWMALHGVDAPLAMDGQELVWQKVWKSFGCTQAEIDKFNCGAAFLPWFRMGNIESYAGPLSQAFMKEDASLQKKILHEEYALGMHPIINGFEGFVPNELVKRSGAKIVRNSSGWAGFVPTTQIQPQDPVFKEIQQRYIRAYHQMIDPRVDTYLIDLYNEMSPQPNGPTKDAELAEIAKDVNDSLGPKAIWAMQGWLFFNDSGYWKEPEVSAFLNAVPNDRMVLFDLYAEYHEIWRDQPAFRNKPYYWCMLHGFGGQNSLFGDLSSLVKKASAAQSDPDHGKLVGMGMTMEGIDENSVQYELLTDLAENSNEFDLNTWINQYGASRYAGSEPVFGSRIWQKIVKAYYSGQHTSWDHARLQELPGATPAKIPPVESLRKEIVSELLSRPELQGNVFYRRDVVDCLKEIAMQTIDSESSAAIAAIQANHPSEARSHIHRFDSLCYLLDRAVSHVPQYRMDTWVNRARNLVPSDATNLTKNARLQVTVWGGPELDDYAAKCWAGLINNYYRLRWDRLFAAMQKPNFKYDKWRQGEVKTEFAWAESPNTQIPVPQGSFLHDVTTLWKAIQ